MDSKLIIPEQPEDTRTEQEIEEALHAELKSMNHMATAIARHDKSTRERCLGWAQAVSDTLPNKMTGAQDPLRGRSFVLYRDHTGTFRETGPLAYMLALLRQVAGYGLEMAANKAKMSPDLLLSLEQGKDRNPDDLTLQNLADALACAAITQPMPLLAMARQAGRINR